MNIGSTAIDVAILFADVGREVAIASAVRQALIALDVMVEIVHMNKKDLRALTIRCRYLTTCVVEECWRCPIAINLTPLEDILNEIVDVIKRCGDKSV